MSVFLLGIHLEQLTLDDQHTHYSFLMLTETFEFTAQDQGVSTDHYDEDAMDDGKYMERCDNGSTPLPHLDSARVSTRTGIL